MKQEEMEDRLRVAAKKYAEGKKQAKRPETQFIAGARWLWDLLMEAKDVIYYEEIIRNEVEDREGKVDKWKNSLITDTAVMMVDRDELQAEIRETGRMIEKHDKNGFPYKESNPLYVHLKEKERSIGMQREHLGLSNKVNVQRIKESAKDKLDPKKDGLTSLLVQARDSMNEIPEL